MLDDLLDGVGSKMFSSYPLDNDQTPAKVSLHISDIDVQGSVRCLWWPPRSARHPSEILLFTAGNPGLPEFYIPFLTSIADKLPPSVAILAHGHIGHAHDLPRPKSDDSLSLKAQVHVAAAVLKSLLAQYPNTPIILLGHSIGAYIALYTASRFFTSIRLIIAVQPTVSHLASTPNGRVMKHIFYAPLITVLAYLAAILVNAFPWILKSLYKVWPNEPLLVLRDFLASPYATRAAMTLAGHEMREVVELDATLIARVRGKLRVLYSESGDGWVGNNSDEVVRQLGEPLSVKFAPIPHAFCINHSKEVAAVCLPWIEAGLAQSHPSMSQREFDRDQNKYLQ